MKTSYDFQDQPLDDNYKHAGLPHPLLSKEGKKGRLKFLHDRIQQAAYALIAKNQKQALHLQIGRLLLINTPSKALDEKVFDIETPSKSNLV